jgi:uncharacterized membrane protein
MPKFITSYLIVLAVMGVFDFLWLGVVSKNFYRNQLGGLMAESINWLPAILFYLIYAFGVTIFLILPLLSGELTLGKGLLLAGLFGAVAYATYDLSNWATLKDWPPIVVLVDIVWGTLFTAVSVYVSYWITKLLL